MKADKDAKFTFDHELHYCFFLYVATANNSELFLRKKF